jgi:NAD(P)-dependent dehydrogenase (short-subunit alcohol dehydrogenase family)
VWQRTDRHQSVGCFSPARNWWRDNSSSRGTGGSIVFITSLSTNFTNPSQVDYAASKAGLRMAMKGFAAALGPHGITCNAVAPGMMLTPMTEHYWGQPGPAEHIKKRVPVGAHRCATGYWPRRRVPGIAGSRIHLRHDAARGWRL